MMAAAIIIMMAPVIIRNKDDDFVWQGLTASISESFGGNMWIFLIVVLAQTLKQVQ